MPSAKIADIPPATLAALNAGTVAARNLVEGLAIDFRKLLAAVAPSLPASAIDSLDPKLGITRRMALAARLLLDHGDEKAIASLLGSPSDTVRGWAAYVVGLTPKLTLKQRLARIKPLAADPHFGVREWAWLAVRPHVAAEVAAAVKILTPWSADPSPLVRRFASEVTRPRGVWCGHINELKASPELGLPVLEPLKADPEKYVQDSVANWLNDAAKTSPAWVRDLCRRWQRESDAPATRRICKRAARSL
ncbi:MAG TPA: DNA alkylation repair protein [Humisphaera sp.]